LSNQHSSAHTNTSSNVCYWIILRYWPLFINYNNGYQKETNPAKVVGFTWIITEDCLPKTATFLNHNKNKEYKRYSWKTTAKNIAGA
jgi:hypothetical protein